MSLQRNFSLDDLEYMKVEKKKEMNDKLKNQHPRLFRLLDALIVVCVLFNFGAVLLTNMMVVKAKPDGVILEGNPVTAKIGGLELHPDAKKLIRAVMIQMIAWLVGVGFYVYCREKIVRRNTLYMSAVLVGFYFIGLGWDVSNNLGLFFGKIIWGI